MLYYNSIIKLEWYNKILYFTPFNISNADFLYSVNYIKINYYITLMNNEDLIKENILYIFFCLFYAYIIFIISIK